MSRFFAGVAIVVTLGVGSRVAVDAQAQQATAMAVPTNCWSCGDEWGENTDQCYWGVSREFGQSATQCNTVWDQGGSRCILLGQFCGNPFFTALDGSATQPAIVLAAGERTQSDAHLRDCSGRIVLRASVVATHGIEQLETLNI